MPSIAPFGDATSAPQQAVRCAKPIPWVKTPAADPTPRAHSVRNGVPSAPNANSQWSAARIHTAGATGAPFRHVQLAVVDRAQEIPMQSLPNTMRNACRSGPASRASSHRTNRPNAVRSKWTTKQTPCHRCRRRRSHRNRTPARQRPLANPKKENHLARPPPRSVTQRLQRQTVHAHLQQFLLANRKKDVRPAPARVFPCRQKSRKPCTSKSPSHFN